MLHYPLNYNQLEYSQIKQEIIEIKQLKDSYVNNELSYLFSLSNPQLRIILKMEQEYCKFNYDMKTFSDIEEMINGHKELSLIIDHSDEINMKIKHKKLQIITNFMNARRIKQIRKKIDEEIEIKRRTKEEVDLTAEEKIELQAQLMNINSETVKNVEIDYFKKRFENKYIRKNKTVLSRIRNEISRISEIPKQLESSEIQMNPNDELMNNQMEEEEHETNENQTENQIKDTNHEQINNQQSKTHENEIKEIKKPKTSSIRKKRKQKKHSIISKMNKSVKKDLNKQKKLAKMSENDEESETYETTED